MGVLDFGGNRRWEGAVSGVNLRRPIVTNGDFIATLCRNAYSDRAVVWRGEWGGPKHSRASTGRGCFWHGFWHFSEFTAYSL